MKLTINELNLSSDTLAIPAQGSANVPVEVENISSKYSDYAIIPCLGWIKNGRVVSTTRSISKENIFTIPPEFFKNSGAIYISIGLVKNDEKIMTNQIVFFVSEAPNSEIELPSDGTWETAVSSLVTSLFNERFQNEINKILEDAKTLNQETKNLQEQINTAINCLGEYEWNGTQIRFKLGDGNWGEYHDIAGDFVTKEELTSATNTVKLLYLIMHPVGDIVFNTSGVNPGTIYGGTWTEWGKGRVPVGVDTDQTEFNIVEKTGGKKEQVLRASIGAVSSNTGSIGYANTPPTPNHDVYQMAIYGTPDTTPRTANHATEVWQDNGQGPTTLQPYITCYMWKRTA
jgi:hypothetical protein|nr:MAG TPA: baseplate wedge subunit [Caudoviricetes sp.]